MKRKLWVTLSVLAIVISVILITTSVVSATTGSQSWFLDQSMVMERGEPADHSGAVDIVAGDEVYWLSDESAVSNVQFPAGDSWTVLLHVSGSWNDYEIQVGAWDATFTNFNTHPGTV